MGETSTFRLTTADREQLERLRRKPGTTRKVCLRADILVAAADGKGVRESARTLQTTTPTVMLWKGRYASGGLRVVLADAPRPGRPRRVTAEKVAEVVERTTREKPVGATHWSTRTLAPVVGLSHTQVHRIWRAHGLKPHREETFKVSTDPDFLTKLEDVVGLYLNPAGKSGRFPYRCQLSPPGWKPGVAVTPPLRRDIGPVLVRVASDGETQKQPDHECYRASNHRCHDACRGRRLSGLGADCHGRLSRLGPGKRRSLCRLRDF